MSRLGMIPIRRLALTLALAAGSLCASGVPAALADPGQVVVNATIYPASSGSVSTASISLGTLDGCPLYSGSSPMYLYPGDQAYSPAASSSWGLSTVLTCGMRLPLNDITNVQVENPSHGFETSLTNAQLSDPSQFHDPDAPYGLPVISADGTENQFTYTRPWLGGLDTNASDQVVSDSSPISIVVYENGPPLTVTALSQTLSRSATAMTMQLRATVENPDGTPVPSSALTWSWNFADESTSADAEPRHSFARGVWPVTVQVTDNSTGRGGTATIQVAFSPSNGSGSANQSGAGQPTRAHAPSGPHNSTGHHPGGAPGKANTNPAPSGNGHSSTGGVPTAAQSSPGKSAAHRRTSSTSTGSASVRPPPAATPHGDAHASARGPVKKTLSDAPTDVRLVAGRLVGDVTPLPPSVSPLVHSVPAALASAPPVRGAIRSSILPALAAGFAVLLLFWLGAARELRGRLDWGALPRFRR